MNARVGIKRVVKPEHKEFWATRKPGSEAVRQLTGLIHNMPWNPAIFAKVGPFYVQKV